MTYSIRDSELRKATGETRARLERELVEAARRPVNGEVAALDAHLCSFEEVFGFSTEEMRTRSRNGSLRETAEVCRWSMLANLRDRLKAAAGR